MKSLAEHLTRTGWVNKFMETKIPKLSDIMLLASTPPLVRELQGMSGFEITGKYQDYISQFRDMPQNTFEYWKNLIPRTNHYPLYQTAENRLALAYSILQIDPVLHYGYLPSEYYKIYFYIARDSYQSDGLSGRYVLWDYPYSLQDLLEIKNKNSCFLALTQIILGHFTQNRMELANNIILENMDLLTQEHSIIQPLLEHIILYRHEIYPTIWTYIEKNIIPTTKNEALLTCLINQGIVTTTGRLQDFGAQSLEKIILGLESYDSTIFDYCLARLETRSRVESVIRQLVKAKPDTDLIQLRVKVSVITGHNMSIPIVFASGNPQLILTMLQKLWHSITQSQKYGAVMELDRDNFLSGIIPAKTSPSGLIPSDPVIRDIIDIVCEKPCNISYGVLFKVFDYSLPSVMRDRVVCGIFRRAWIRGFWWAGWVGWRGWCCPAFGISGCTRPDWSRMEKIRTTILTFCWNISSWLWLCVAAWSWRG